MYSGKGGKCKTKFSLRSLMANELRNPAPRYRAPLKGLRPFGCFAKIGNGITVYKDLRSGCTDPRFASEVFFGSRNIQYLSLRLKIAEKAHKISGTNSLDIYIYLPNFEHLLARELILA